MSCSLTPASMGSMCQLAIKPVAGDPNTLTRILPAAGNGTRSLGSITIARVDLYPCMRGWKRRDRKGINLKRGYHETSSAGRIVDAPDRIQSGGHPPTSSQVSSLFLLVFSPRTPPSRSGQMEGTGTASEAGETPAPLAGEGHQGGQAVWPSAPRYRLDTIPEEAARIQEVDSAIPHNFFRTARWWGDLHIAGDAGTDGRCPDASAILTTAEDRVLRVYKRCASPFQSSSIAAELQFNGE